MVNYLSDSTGYTIDFTELQRHHYQKQNIIDFVYRISDSTLFIFYTISKSILNQQHLPRIINQPGI